MNPFSRAAGLRRHTNFSNSTSSVASADPDSSRSLLSTPSFHNGSFHNGSQRGSFIRNGGSALSRPHAVPEPDESSAPDSVPRASNPYSRAGGVRGHKDLRSEASVPRSEASALGAISTSQLPAMKLASSPMRTTASTGESAPLVPHRPAAPSGTDPGTGEGRLPSPRTRALASASAASPAPTTLSDILTEDREVSSGGAGTLPPIGRTVSKTPSGRLGGQTDAGSAATTAMTNHHGRMHSGGSDNVERTPPGGQAPPGHVSAPTTPRRRMFGKRTRVQPMGDTVGDGAGNQHHNSVACSIL